METLLQEYRLEEFLQPILDIGVYAPLEVFHTGKTKNWRESAAEAGKTKSAQAAACGGNAPTEEQRVSWSTSGAVA